MSTFLQLVQAVHNELGLPGNGPATVTTGATGESLRLINMIKRADLDIKRRFIDWKFLWRQTSGVTVAAGANTLTGAPTDVGKWDVDALFLNKALASYSHLVYGDYAEYRDQINVGGTLPTRRPDKVYETPAGTLLLDSLADQTYTFDGEYWKKAVELSADSDESDIPSEFHRIIEVRAKIIYAEAEDAPEIMIGSTTEWEDLWDQLTSRYLPDQSIRKFARAPDSLSLQVIAS